MAKPITRTVALEIAKRRGIEDAELAVAAKISVWTIVSLRAGRRGVGDKAREGLQRAFPDIPPDVLFYEEESNGKERA